jgi:hypothetical protein
MKGIFSGLFRVPLHVFLILGNRRHQHRLIGAINSECRNLVELILLYQAAKGRFDYSLPYTLYGFSSCHFFDGDKYS